MVAGDYSRYDLQELVNEPGKGRVGMRDFLDNLDYAVHMEGYPMPWTRASNSDATQPPQPDQYFVEPVTYVLTNDTFYGYDEHNDLSSKVLLNSDDYQIDSIAFNMNCVDREYNPSTAAFDRNKKLEYMDGEAVTIYGQFGSGSDFVEIAKYDMKTRTFTQLNADYIDTGKTYGGTDAKIVFKEDMGCTGYRMETTNQHYYTRFANVPNLRIKYKEGGNHITELVKFGAEATESIGIEDVATMQIYDYKEELKKEYSAGGESGVDYVRIVEKESVLEKNATATRNNTKKRQYTITWKLHMEETMRMGMDTVEAVGQNSGIFYDLLPIGSVFDANPDSIVIRTDEGDLSASQYRIIQHENYKDSGRTLLEIQIFADAKFYDIYYDTVHPYESLKDYGNIVVNPIVYKTGNPTIANGHPDEAQYYKDDMSDENKTYLTDIDEDGTVDPNSRQYIDNEKIFDVTGPMKYSAGSGNTCYFMSFGPDAEITAPSMTLNSTCHFYTEGTVNISGETKVTQQGITWINNGHYTTGSMYFSAGNSTFYNYCQLIVTGNCSFKDGLFNMMDNSYAEFGTALFNNFHVNMGNNAGFNVKNGSKWGQQGAGIIQGFFAKDNNTTAYVRLAGTTYIPAHKGYAFQASGAKMTIAYEDMKFYKSFNFYIDQAYANSTYWDEITESNPLPQGDERGLADFGNTIQISGNDFSKVGFRLTEGQCAATWHGDEPDPSSDIVRVICEDLSVKDDTDWDFNDAVFDVQLFDNNSKVKITLRAAGGTLPLYIGNDNEAVEIHAKFKEFNPGLSISTGTMLSTGTSNSTGKYAYTGCAVPSYFINNTFGSTVKEVAKNIPIKVQKLVNGEMQLILLECEKGKATAKVAVNKDFDWCDERQHINSKYTYEDTYGNEYGGFSLFVRGIFSADEWYNYNGPLTPEMVEQLGQ